MKSSRNISKSIGLCALAVIVILLPLVMKWQPYYLHLVIMSGINMILAMAFLMLIAVGRITIGASAFWGIGGYASALLTMELGVSFWLALPLAGLIAGVIGLVLGGIMLRTPGMAFVVLTMVINMVFFETVGHVELFGGWAGLVGIPRPDPISVPFLGTIQFVGKTSYYYLMISLLALTALVYYAFYESRIGRAWKAIKLHEKLAETLGIKVWRYRLLAFVVGTIFSGFAGSFFAHYFQTLDPMQFTVFKSVYVQIYGILGGLDFYIAGPAIGSIIMTFLPEFFRAFAEYEPIFSGLLLIVLVVFFPQGIMGLTRTISPAENITRVFNSMTGVTSVSRSKRG